MQTAAIAVHDQTCSDLRALIGGPGSTARTFLARPSVGHHNGLLDGPRPRWVWFGSWVARVLECVRTTSVALDAAIAALPASAWQAPVVTAQSRTITFDEVPWMRARETLVHAWTSTSG